MMYKKLMLWGLLIILLTICRSSKAIASEIEEAEILIIFNNSLSKKEVLDIQSMVTILTYLQHSVVYATVDESATLLNNYEFIVCYGLKEMDENFMKSLAKADNRVFMMGCSGVQEYCAIKGYNFTGVNVKNTMAEVNYEFSKENKFSSLLYLEDNDLLSGQFDYHNGEITVNHQQASLYSGYDNFVYMISSDLSTPLMKAAFTKEVALWLWPFLGEPHPYAQYLVINEVYPFTPPDELMEVVDYFVEYQLPFVISVMPIYENGDYPAMKHFCEILRYAQANGGAIIMHVPNILQEGNNVDLIWEYLTIATEAYRNYEVYPLGIQVPESYMFTETGRAVLSRYSTVFLFEERNRIAIDLNDYMNHIYKDGHKLIGPAIELDHRGVSQIMVHSTALYLDIYEGVDKLKTTIQAHKQSDIPFKSLWESDHVVYANNYHLYTNQKQVYINQSKVTLDFKPFSYENKFDYKNTVFQWIIMDLRDLNNMLVGIVVLSSTIFLYLIVKARIINKRKFLHPKEGIEKK